MAPEPGTSLDRTPYELEVEDTFDRPTLDPRLWIPFYLPHWSSRKASAARYQVGGGTLRLRIESDQQRQSPAYPMQFMLNVYEFADGPDPVSPPDRYPKEFVVECFRGHRPLAGPASRRRAWPA